MPKKSNSIIMTIDEKDLKKAFNKLEGVENGSKTAIVRSMNVAVNAMRPAGWREINKRYTLKSKKYYTDNLTIRRANMSKMQAEFRSQGRPIRAVKFRYRKNINKKRGTKNPPDIKGYSKRSRERGKDKGKRKQRNNKAWNKGYKPAWLDVLRSTPGSYIHSNKNKSNAFVAPFKAGQTQNVGIFRRTGNKLRRPIGARNSRKYQQKIQQVYRIGAADMLARTRISNPLQETAQNKFSKEVDRQISLLLKR